MRFLGLNAAIGAAALLGASIATASELDFNIGDESVNVQVNMLPQSRDFETGLGYLYHKGGGHLLNGDLHARGQTAIGNLPTTVGIGAQLDVFTESDVDGSAIALGGYAHIKIPSVPGLGLKVAGHFAPSITSFQDAEQFSRFDVKTTYRVIPNADIYLGYRVIKADIERHDDITLDEGLNVGFALQF
ncbi:YfaZ family outer membrane protein [Hahella aquimaris]|uniref:YfaZ family outer membrane protein n=1 Tax=Hahella sp. HNIBRBA332 TaxID=3015983 RepID=UPI00273C55E6|nr:YfaZ family outer membrane protein [Hahella sp. HNIBRBA332]WLQ14615.1 YfaZ family outer membrane protein [Hahella sp. HNIBRBA332]